MIRLRDGERQTLEIEGSKFHYRPIPGDKLADLEAKAVNVTGQAGRGREAKLEFSLGMDKLRWLIVEWGLTGWEGVEGPDGKPVEFAPDRIHWLPSEVVTDLALAIQGQRLSEAERGNSSR